MSTAQLAPLPEVHQAYTRVASRTVNPSDLDQKALILRYLPLVRTVVDRIKLNLPSHIDADDLYSVGVTGLIAALRKHDSDRDNTFVAYASMRIRGAILDELRQMDWCPRRARANARKMKAAIGELEQRLGRVPSHEELRAELGLSEKKFSKWLEEAKPVTFLAIDRCTQMDDSEGASLHELLADPTDVTGRDQMEQEEMRELVLQRIKDLPELPRKLLALYYHENMRLSEIAAVFNLTESRICQIHAQTILGLRSYIERARNL